MKLEHVICMLMIRVINVNASFVHLVKTITGQLNGHRMDNFQEFQNLSS